jgi:hypothetical protein
MAAADPEDDGRHKDKLRGGGGGGGQPGFAGLQLPAPVIDEDRHRAPDCQEAQHRSKHHQQAGAALLQSKAVAVAQLPQVICLRDIEHQQEDAAERDGHSCCVQGVDVFQYHHRLAHRRGEGRSSGEGAPTPSTATASALSSRAREHTRARGAAGRQSGLPLMTRVRQPSGVQRYGPRTAASIQISHPNLHTGHKSGQA